MVNDTTPSGPALKLRQFIDSTGMTDAQIAAAIGISGAALSSYLREKDPKVPADKVRRAIERWTKGKIKRGEWETAAEREALDRVIPFSRAAGGR